LADAPTQLKCDLNCCGSVLQIGDDRSQQLRVNLLNKAMQAVNDIFGV